MAQASNSKFRDAAQFFIANGINLTDFFLINYAAHKASILSHQPPLQPPKLMIQPDILLETSHHPSPPMDNMLAMLWDHIRRHELHSHVHGRKVSTPPLNSIVEGLLLGTREASVTVAEANEPDWPRVDEVDTDEYSDAEFDLMSILADEELDELE
ncbi:hypothetical protein RSAG8_08824, partial [Rhizoctonia solani AG-8 WAC10335]